MCQELLVPALWAVPFLTLLFPHSNVWFPNLPVNQVGAGEEKAHFSIGLQSPTPRWSYFSTDLLKQAS